MKRCYERTWSRCRSVRSLRVPDGYRDVEGGGLGGEPQAGGVDLEREEGLKVPKKQPKRGRLWLTDGSCIRLRPLYRHHVWAYDFVADRTHDGRPLKMLTVLE